MPSTPKQNSGVGRPTDSPAKARRTCLFPRVDTGPHQAHCHHHPQLSTAPHTCAAGSLMEHSTRPSLLGVNSCQYLRQTPHVRHLKR